MNRLIALLIALTSCGPRMAFASSAATSAQYTTPGPVVRIGDAANIFPTLTVTGSLSVTSPATGVTVLIDSAKPSALLPVGFAPGASVGIDSSRNTVTNSAVGCTVYAPASALFQVGLAPSASVGIDANRNTVHLNEQLSGSVTIQSAAASALLPVGLAPTASVGIDANRNLVQTPTNGSTVITAAGVALSTTNTGWQVFPSLYSIYFTGTDTGAWKDTRGNNSAIFYVEMAVGGGRSATLIVNTTMTMTGGTPDNGTHGVQVGQNIVASGIYSFSPVGQFTKIQINASNGATCSVGCMFKW